MQHIPYPKSSIFHALAAAIVLLIPSLAEADVYWNGTGNDKSGGWFTASYWSPNADGSGIRYGGPYGGETVIFSASKVSEPQVLRFDGSSSVAGVRFIEGGPATKIVGGKIDSTLTIDHGGIAVSAKHGQVTFGTGVSGQRLNVSMLPGTISNDSAATLTFLDGVQIRNWGGLTVSGSGNTHIAGDFSQANEQVTLDKKGSGDLTLSGKNRYSGATVIHSGRVIINGDQSGSTGAVSVGKGATLGGTGSIGGDTNFAASAIHAPGLPGAVGLQKFGRGDGIGVNLNYETGVVFSWDIDPSKVQVRGVGYDAVDVTGKITGKNAVFEIAVRGPGFADPFWSSEQAWKDIFTSDGKSVKTDWTELFAGVKAVDAYGSAVDFSKFGSFNMSGNTLAWTPNFIAPIIPVVPEPSSALAGILLMLGILRRRRK